MKNKIIWIGYIGIRKCYLNVEREKAIERYLKEEKMTKEEFEEFDISVGEIEFNDMFEAYDIWE